MAAYNFSRAERYAVFTVHHERCWLCDLPVSLLEMEIDHIIPEHLEEDSKALAGVLHELGLPETFRLNSFENWMPAHRRCNEIKSGLVFRPSPLIQARLQIAIRRAERARTLAERYIRDGRIDRAISDILIAEEKGSLSTDHKKALSSLFPVHDHNRELEDRGKPFEIAPWLTLVSEDANWFHFKGPGGMVGSRPKGDKLHISWDCPRCGPTAWNGVKCVICGQMDDGD